MVIKVALASRDSLGRATCRSLQPWLHRAVFSDQLSLMKSDTRKIATSALKSSFLEKNSCSFSNREGIFPLRKRTMATKEDFQKQDQEEKAAEAAETNSQMALRKLQGGASAAVLVGSLGLTWYSVKGIMGAIGAVYSQPHLIAYISYWLGVASAGGAAGVAFGIYRMTFIRPENVFNQTLSVVTRDPQAQKLLGYNITAASVKSYEIKDGKLFFETSTSFPTWKPHVCEMSFLLYGSERMGLVTTKCTKVMSLVPGRLSIDFVALDILDKERIDADTETVMLVGEKNQLNKANSIYHLLDLKTAAKEGKI